MAEPLFLKQQGGDCFHRGGSGGHRGRGAIKAERVCRLVLPGVRTCSPLGRASPPHVHSARTVPAFEPIPEPIVPLEALKLVSLGGLWSMPKLSQAILRECRGSRGLLFILGGLLLILGGLLVTPGGLQLIPRSGSGGSLGSSRSPASSSSGFGSASGSLMDEGEELRTQTFHSWIGGLDGGGS